MRKKTFPERGNLVRDYSSFGIVYSGIITGISRCDGKIFVHVSSLKRDKEKLNWLEKFMCGNILEKPSGKYEIEKIQRDGDKCWCFVF